MLYILNELLYIIFFWVKELIFMILYFNTDLIEKSPKLVSLFRSNLNKFIIILNNLKPAQ